MISHYVVLANRIQRELVFLETMVERCERAVERGTHNVEDREFYIAAAALYLHDFYNGAERLFEVIAAEIDDNVPTGRSWHRDLLIQMTLDLPDIRPPVLTSECIQALDEYLRFRHVVRNVYAFQLDAVKITPLVVHLRKVYKQLRVELQAFVDFLHQLSRADEPKGDSV